MHQYRDKRQMDVGDNEVFLPNDKSVLAEILCACSLQYSTSLHQKLE